MADDDFLAKAAIGGLALLAAIVVSFFSNRNEVKHTVYEGVVDGQQVTYREFPDRNEMEVKGKRGVFRLTDSEGFHRLTDPAYTNDTLETVTIDLGRNNLVCDRYNTNCAWFEKGVYDSLFSQSERFYGTVRQLAKEKGILKLEKDEPVKNK